MVSRGRTNTASKSTAKKTTIAPKASPQAKAKGKKTSLIASSLSALKGASGLYMDAKSRKATKGGSVVGHKSAKLLLKRAYERRAKRQIRLNQLGQARRTLRKKQTVI